ncbi:MAG TPA: Ig-like domain-containing protein [Acidobacteriota bacterium]|nr:Ig-like domain-containing protein [Acidobacteriota bacterium]
MKSRLWSMWVAVAALMVVSLAVAAPAGAVSFTLAHDGDGCAPDTVTFTPATFGGTPDSIHWSWGDGSWDTDVAAPWDTAHIYAASLADTVVMHAWFAAVDSTFTDSIIVGRAPVPAADGRDVDENDSVMVNVLGNDELFVSPLDTLFLLDSTANGPYHGTAHVNDSNYVVYIPDLNYHGTDSMVYQIETCAGTATATIAITIVSDGIVGINAAGWANFGAAPCPSVCDTVTGGTWSIGDSLQFYLQIPPWDVPVILSGYPKVFFDGLGGSPSGNVMVQEDTLGDSTMFWFVNDSTWWMIPDDGIDVARGFYDIQFRVSGAGGTFDTLVQVPQPIDTDMPTAPLAPVWELYRDLNSDGIAAVGDTMRFYLDLTNNPFEEICSVFFTLWDWPSTGSSVNLVMDDSFEDGKYELFYPVPAGGILGIDTTAGATHHIEVHFVDDACNLDSIAANYVGQIDTRNPDLSYIYDTSFVRLLDLDSNNCLGIGDKIRFSFRDTANTDIIGYWADMFGWAAWFNDSTAMGYGVADSTDSSHIRVVIPGLGGTQYGLDWTLEKYPLKQAVDLTQATNLFIWIYAEDDAGNVDSAKIMWTGTNPITPSVDTRVPTPVTIDSCVNSANGLGERVVTVYWSDQADDAARFRIFWDDNTGTLLTGDDDTLAGYYFPADSNWSSDGTVSLSWCRDYLFTVWTVDDCGNLEIYHPDACLSEGTTPTPVSSLACESRDSNVIALEWRATDFSIDEFYVFYGRDQIINYADTVDVIPFVDTGMYYWTTNDPVPPLDLEEGGHYWFTVRTVDTCGNPELTHPDSTDCWADMAPAEVCVFQPDTLSCYSTDYSIFVCNKTEGDEDVVSVTAKGRLADTSVAADTVPGPWVILGSATDPAGAECFNVVLSGLDALVGTDTMKTVELVFTTVDKVGKVLTDSAAYVACVFTFDWSTQVPVGSIVMVDSTYRTYQPYCGLDGWEASGPGHTVDVSVVGGVPPYTIEVRADDDGSTGNNDEIAYVENVYATDTTFTFDATGWSKGAATLTVLWTDWCGTTTSDEVDLCVPDEIAPCAEITNPVDGKCIRRSRSTQDPVPLWVTVNPDENCLDYEDVMKIDFQWADCCGDIGPPTITRVMDSTAIDCPEGPGSGVPDCDTFWVGGIPGGLWDSVNCIDTTTSAICWQFFWIYDTIPDTCVWTTIAIIDEDFIQDAKVEIDSRTFWTTDWWNTEDLAWITESGTIIYLRAIVWDYNNNSFTTECVMVCVDIDTPPLCIWSPDICYDGDVPSIAGTIDIVAELNLDLANIDDLENVTLWYKESREADRIENWTNYGSGSRATNASEWRWSFNTSGLVDGISYDFRVIAQTIWGTYSYDYNGDLQFDSETFDTAGCDMVTWLVDRTAPQVAFDTVWTLVDGAEIIQPNVGCALSDPRGWLWSQYGQTITVMPWVYPVADQGDIVRIQYTLYDGEGDCAQCDCTDGGTGGVDLGGFTPDTCEYKVLKIVEGAGLLDAVTLDPSVAPFVELKNGYQKHILHVEVWDGCGNSTEDCVEWYMLDIDPTEGIVVNPINDEVFCQDHLDMNDTGGGIEINALRLLGEAAAEVTFYYSSDGVTWIAIPDANLSDLTAMWYPHALGLAEGKWYLSVGVVDGAGNISDPGTYMTAVWFDCATPVVTLDVPTAGAWMGCEIDLRATATSSAINPIDSVVFFYQLITSTTPVRIGADLYTADGSTFGYNWDPPKLEGPYFMFARAWNRAGIMAQSANGDGPNGEVQVKFDGTNPWAVVIEVDGDVNGGDEMNPTVVTAGDAVPIYAIARDNMATWGMGAIDNCGIDSVIFYVENAANLKVFGVMMMVDPAVDSLYSVTWPTTGLPTGSYEAWVEVWDCGCNNGASAKWVVSVVNPVPAGTIAVDEAIDCCGYPTVDGVQGLDINVTPAGNADIDSIVIWRCLEVASDVYDQYVRVGKLTSVIDGVWHPAVDFDPLGWAEGVHRLRAAIYDGSTTSEDVNNNGKFDDFTFNADLLHHMKLWVDRTVTDFTVSHVATLKAGNDLTVTVDPVADCEIAEVCYGVVTMDEVFAEHGCGGLTYSFDPVDSGLVSLNHGMWHGYIHTDVVDCVSNAVGLSTELWILDMATTQAMVVTPAWGAPITGTSYALTARKLSSVTNIDSVVFYYGAALPGTRIAKGTKSGDEFTATWNLTAVADGNTNVWAKAFVGTSGDANPPKIHVLVAKAPTNIVLNAPIPSFTRTVWGEALTFVGSRVDLCVNRESISSVVSGVGIDRVVFAYRAGNAPGELPEPLPTNPDPALGWVVIGEDIYGSLCVDWFTDSTLLETPDCTDGRVAVAAWVYDKAGNVNHSNILHVMIDNTSPYTEIHDIDGDETFGDCHVVADANAAVKISGMAIDNLSCAGDDLATNSGAKYLQFFVGECGVAGGCVDVVWVIDYSGSIQVDDIPDIEAGAATFFGGLADVDVRVGVLAYTDVSKPVSTTGELKTGSAGSGEFTTDASTFATMVGSLDGLSGSSTENGLTALNDALAWYPWRVSCRKVLILVTDENADEVDLCADAEGDLSNYALQGPILNSGAAIFTVLGMGGVACDTVGYSGLAEASGGLVLDIDASWGANLAATASQIASLASAAQTAEGIIWGQQVTLTDGQTEAFAYWDPSGLPDGEYCAWTVAIDEIGNTSPSAQVRICLEDEIPPVGWVAGFGETYDCPTSPEDCVTDYMIYAQTCDPDVAMAQVQRRPEGSSDPTAWTTMGIGTMVAGDSTVWRFDWNPCLLGDANYEMRVIMTDENGNSWLSIGDAARAAHPEWTPPVLHVDLDGACGVAIAAASVAQSNVGFEDKTFANLGLVNVDDQVDGNGIDKQHWMLAVYADMYAGLATEKVLLWQDYSNSAHFMGSFDDSSILGGGTGKMWLAYNLYGTGATTYLTKGDLMVYHVEADLGFPGCVTDGDIGATVCIEPGALSAENGVVLFPARFPTRSLRQEHYQTWPNINGTATAIRLTSPIAGFRTGKYATITISYNEAAVAAAGLTTKDLVVAWWDGNAWSTDGFNFFVPGAKIADGVATFGVSNLHGIYAVVSDGGLCIDGALTVTHEGQVEGYDSWTGPRPTIYTKVKSNIEEEHNNRDIDPNSIIVVLDRGTDDALTLWSNGVNPSNGFYFTSWDSVSGILSTKWNSGAPPLSEGSHTLYVKAFNKSGLCNADTWSFNVDATEPDVDVVGKELCQNPVFTVTITDMGAGVDWDSVYVDVYDITGSEFAVVPASRLIHTETPDAYQPMADPNTFSFELVMHTAQERRLHIVVYDGTRSSVYDSLGCNCEYYVYRHDIHGVPDLAGNHTEVVEEIFVVSGPCGVEGDSPDISLAEGSFSPFDPWKDGSVCFELNGFTGSGVVTATVYDLAGKVVNVIHHDAISGQSGSVCWFGDSQEGGMVAEGVYLIHFQAQGGQTAAMSQVVKLPVKKTD